MSNPSKDLLHRGMSENRIKVLIAGDFCAYSPDNINIGAELQNIIDAHDIRILNFEGPLQAGELHTAGNFYLRQSDKSPQWCVEHGFNVVGLANNHAYDFGECGLKATERALSNITTVGCGDWNDAYSIRYVEIKNRRIGLFAATSADLASLKDSWTDKEKFGCPWINHPCVADIIRQAKEYCDIIIVLPHAGVEYMNVPLPEWRDIYRKLIDVGADAVIASHPHVPQGWEYYMDKPIFYSLGNFVFDNGAANNAPYWNNGIVASLEIADDKITATAHLTLFNDGTVNINHSDEELARVEDLCGILKDGQRYMQEVNSGVLKFYPKYEGWLLNGMSGIKYAPRSLRQAYRIIRAWLKNDGGGENERVALHQLREESTRWTLIRAYKLLSKTDL